jgi:SAM-dependent methyltransferase
MSGKTSEPSPTRAEIWDARHAASGPIESADADPTLVEEVSSMTPGLALDLGAGDGRNALWLAGHGWRVSAVDFSVVAIDRGKALGASAGVKIDWHHEDLLAWTPPTAEFDLVALFFIHLPEDERRVVYTRAASAVRPGGTLLVVGHDRSNLRDGFGGPQDPDVLFTPVDIVRDLPTGFTVMRAETVRRPGVPSPAPLDAIVRTVRSDIDTVQQTT